MVEDELNIGATPHQLCSARELVAPDADVETQAVTGEEADAFDERWRETPVWFGMILDQPAHALDPSYGGEPV